MSISNFSGLPFFYNMNMYSPLLNSSWNNPSQFFGEAITTPATSNPSQAKADFKNKIKSGMSAAQAYWSLPKTERDQLRSWAQTHQHSEAARDLQAAGIDPNSGASVNASNQFFGNSLGLGNFNGLGNLAGGLTGLNSGLTGLNNGLGGWFGNNSQIANRYNALQSDASAVGMQLDSLLGQLQPLLANPTANASQIASLSQQIRPLEARYMHDQNRMNRLQTIAQQMQSWYSNNQFNNLWV